MLGNNARGRLVGLAVPHVAGTGLHVGPLDRVAEHAFEPVEQLQQRRRHRSGGSPGASLVTPVVTAA